MRGHVYKGGATRHDVMLPGGGTWASKARGMTLSFDQAITGLEAAGSYECWREDFGASSDWVGQDALQPLDGQDLVEQCRWLGFPARAVDLLVENRDTWEQLSVWRLGAHLQWQTCQRYTREEAMLLGWPPPPPDCPLFYAYAYLGLVERCRARHGERGIPESVTTATLWDIGQQVALHERLHGEPGMAKGWWLAHHVTDHLFQLGRLQFQRAASWGDNGPLSKGEPFLDVHIPESGPMSPDACAEAFQQARDFFPRHFPEDRASWFGCISWLLDPQLQELLPHGSNILDFQRRFETRRVIEQGNPSVFAFVFHRPDLDAADDPDVDGLPQNTTLERALVDFYAQGGRLYPALGVIPFNEG